MTHYLFTSESVSIGHPDKVADQISDAVLDACLAQDPNSRVACETLVSQGLVVLAGEITTNASFEMREVVRQTIEEIGYNDCRMGFDFRSCGIITSINRQSQDIAIGVNEEDNAQKQQGAGDQGLMFGFACNDTAELMPLPIMLAHRVLTEVKRVREEGEISWLRPDAKSQITVEYDQDHNPVRVHTVVISTMHAPEVTHPKVCADMKMLAQRVIPAELLDENTIYYINPTGRFVTGGPEADCGLTGRKLMVDTYGGMGRHGGGAFSGKDPSKVDRSAAYAARYVAKNIVAAQLARRCEVQVSYAIGVAQPVSIKVDTFGTGTVNEELLARAIPLVFDLTPKGIIQMLDLRRPIYRKTASGGHFGRHEPEFSWEKTDRVAPLLQAVKQETFTLQ
ncbi:MAG: methionine adenosyltransferase [Chlamydiales bacterium]|nr:methionine adenosyltransferase [Chlamydiales bacterium]